MIDIIIPKSIEVDNSDIVVYNSYTDGDSPNRFIGSHSDMHCALSAKNMLNDASEKYKLSSRYYYVAADMVNWIFE